MSAEFDFESEIEREKRNCLPNQLHTVEHEISFVQGARFGYRYAHQSGAVLEMANALSSIAQEIWSIDPKDPNLRPSKIANDALQCYESELKKMVDE
jgi:hypothetical protein